MTASLRNGRSEIRCQKLGQYLHSAANQYLPPAVVVRDYPGQLHRWRPNASRRGREPDSGPAEAVRVEIVSGRLCHAKFGGCYSEQAFVGNE